VSNTRRIIAPKLTINAGKVLQLLCGAIKVSSTAITMAESTIV
jgi:hypothetical protein